MITRLENHWDKIYTTSYARFMVRVDAKDIENNTETIFIKRSASSGNDEKAWKGYVDKIDKKLGKIHFRVNLNKQIPIPSQEVFSYGRWVV